MGAEAPRSNHKSASTSPEVGNTEGYWVYERRLFSYPYKVFRAIFGLWLLLSILLLFGEEKNITSYGWGFFVAFTDLVVAFLTACVFFIPCAIVDMLFFKGHGIKLQREKKRMTGEEFVVFKERSEEERQRALQNAIDRGLFD